MEMNAKRWIAGLAALAVVGVVAAALFFWGAIAVVADGRGFGCPYGSPNGSGFWRQGMMGGLGRDMMGGVLGSPAGVKPLGVDEARSAVGGYLAGVSNPDLQVAEIMIFDNHAYAEVVEASTGIGAFEVLIDPVTLAVYLEPGPNMMWNLKHGHMGTAGGYGMMGGWGRSRDGAWTGPGMMPWSGAATVLTPDEMPVSALEAITIAQRYLDAHLPEAEAADDADPFYGYYTIHILREGQVSGMLSVNGYGGQVFVHTWHGEFAAMSEDHEG